jgi:hypothetical protein
MKREHTAKTFNKTQDQIRDESREFFGSWYWFYRDSGDTESADIAEILWDFVNTCDNAVLYLWSKNVIALNDAWKAYQHIAAYLPMCA